MRSLSDAATGRTGLRQVKDNPAQSRYELQFDAGIGVVDYRVAGKVRTLTHAEVPHALRGTGAASELVSGALDLARSQGSKVVPRCSYIAHFIERHPEYADLVVRG